MAGPIEIYFSRLLLITMTWRPFRARRPGGRFPGLKPRAKIRSPSGAINYPKSCLSSRHSTLGFRRCLASCPYPPSSSSFVLCPLSSGGDQPLISYFRAHFLEMSKLQRSHCARSFRLDSPVWSAITATGTKQSVPSNVDV